MCKSIQSQAIAWDCCFTKQNYLPIWRLSNG